MYIQRWLKVYHAVDAFVVPCRFMKERLVEGGFPARRIHLLRYPVADRDLPPDRTHEKKPYIVYFGRIAFEKGLDTLIEAFQQLHHDVSLCLAGNSRYGEQERLQKLIRPDQRGRIRFLGFQSGEALTRLIGEALFSVVPSRWYDNAPLSIYESFLQGTPVVAADIGGIPEQISDGVNGRLFTPGSVAALNSAMSWMLSDLPRLARMGRAGQRYVMQELSLASHTRDLLNLFQQLIEGKKQA